MTYAIVELGGRQWKVEPGTRLDINRVATEVGGQIPVERVLFGYDGSQARMGRPYVPGAKVVCEVVEHRLGPKEISYHFRRRENWRKTVGHRQPLTRLIVKEILFEEVAAAEEPSGKVSTKTATPKARKPKTTKTIIRKRPTKTVGSK